MVLRIKDNVDLKELKKYGFKYDIKYKYYFYNEEGNSYGYDEIYIEKDRIIQLGYEPSPYFIENCLYELIKADLVEKVEDK